ncbi:unnamed protein product [Sphagnum tenellum]
MRRPDDGRGGERGLPRLRLGRPGGQHDHRGHRRRHRQASGYVDCLDWITLISILNSPNMVFTGFCINGPAHVSDSKTPLSDKLSGLESDKFRHIVKVLHEVNARAPDVFAELGTDCLFDIKMVTVEQGCRSKGLGRELLSRAVELARVLGFKGCKAEATGKS